MHIPGRGQDYSKSSSACRSPELGLVFDASNQRLDGRLRGVENAVITVFPYHPGCKKRRGCQTLAHWFGRDLPSVVPPVQEGGLVLRRPAGHAHPGEDLIPDVPRKGATEEEMAHRLGLLAAKGADSMVLQSMSGEAVCRPAAVQADEPVKEFHFRGRPALPSKFPVAAGRRTVEGSDVGRFGSVGARRVPLPHKLVRCVREYRGLDQAP